VVEKTTSRDEITVLICDDHGVVREGLRALLEREGIDVVGEASTGREAIELTRKLQPRVVLLDVRMPDGDGLEALAAIKATDPHISVIMLTIYTNAGYLAKAVANGAAGYLSKEVDPARIPRAVYAVAGGEELLDRSALLAALASATGVERRDVTDTVPLEDLTERESTVLSLIAEGLNNEEIADLLVIGLSTVKTHVNHIFRKLGVSDRTQAALWAIRHGMTNP
jgi:DNA-binding NarL/FixJ family response regulator